MANNVQITAGIGTVIETIDEGRGVERQVIVLGSIGNALNETQLTAGQKTSATSIPIVVASDQSAVPVTVTEEVTVTGTFWPSVQQVSISDGEDVTLGAQTDPANPATDTTAVSVIGILKQISRSIQGAAASLAGTLSAAVTLTAGTNNIGFVGPSGSLGVDYSTNTPSTSGLTLLATIPASNIRLGYFIQSQDTNGLTVVLDDQAGSLTSTIIQLSGASDSNSQGPSLDMSGLPHTGRIRIYSTSSSVQMAARVW